MLEEGAHDRFAARGDRGGQAGRPRVGRLGRIGADIEQAHDQRCVARSGRAYQRRCALGIDAADGETEIQQLVDRIDVAGRRGRRQVRSAQSAPRQAPARPAQPVDEIAVGARQGQAECRLAARRGCLGIRAVPDQCAGHRNRSGTAGLQRVVQRSASARIARICIAAAGEKLFDEAGFTECAGQMDGADLTDHPAEAIGAASDELMDQGDHVGVLADPGNGEQHARHERGSTDCVAALQVVAQGLAGCGQTGQQRFAEQAAVVEAHVGRQTEVEDPGSRPAVLRFEQAEIEVGALQRRLPKRLLAHLFGYVPVTEAQRVEQMRGVFLAGRDRFAGQAARQGETRIEQGDDRPAARGRGMLDRTASVASGDLAVGAKGQQGAHHVLAGRARGAGNDQRRSTQRVDAVRIDLVPGQGVDDRHRAGARRFHQRGRAVAIEQVGLGAGREQGFGDLRVAGQRRRHQRRTIEQTSAVDLDLALEQQLDPARIVLGHGRREQQRGLRILDFGLRPAIEQEVGQRPVAIGAGDAERGAAFAIDRIDLDPGIDQQRGDDRLSAQRGMMQDRVRIDVGDGRVGAIGEQGHDRVGPALEAVARSRDQRRHAAMRAVDIDALGDQCTQQAQVGQDDRMDQDAALVAIAGQRRHVRIGAAFECGKGEVDLAGAGRGEQRGTGIEHADVIGQLDRFGTGFVALFVAATRGALGPHVEEQEIDAAHGRGQPGQRHDHQRIQDYRGNAHFERQPCPERGQRQRADTHDEHSQRRRQAVAEEHVMLGGELAGETERTTQREGQPGTRSLGRIGLIPDEGQHERRPQAPQREQRKQHRRRQGQGAGQRRLADQPPGRGSQHQGDEDDVEAEQNEAGQAPAHDAAQKAAIHAEADAGADRGQHPGVAEQKQDQHRRVRDPDRRAMQ